MHHLHTSIISVSRSTLLPCNNNNNNNYDSLRPRGSRWHLSSYHTQKYFVNSSSLNSIYSILSILVFSDFFTWYPRAVEPPGLEPAVLQVPGGERRPSHARPVAVVLRRQQDHGRGHAEQDAGYDEDGDGHALPVALLGTGRDQLLKLQTEIKGK